MLHPSLVLFKQVLCCDPTSSMGAVQTEDVGTSLAQNNDSSCHGFGECLGSTKHAKRKFSCFQDLSSLRFDEEESVSNFDRKTKKKLCPILFGKQVKVKSASGAP